MTMRGGWVRIKAAMLAGAAVFATALAGCDPPRPLAWAYPRADKPGPLPEAPPGLQHVPGSAITLTKAQVDDDLNPPDWFPQAHPAPPAIVAHGRHGGPTPCAECHLMNGEGFLGAPSLAGLPAAYIIQQVREFRSGRRVSSEPGRPATGEMIKVARTVSDPELASAAAYFAALRPASWVRMVETDTAPATRPDFYGWLDLVPGAPPEPIRGRIIEAPEDTARMILEDPHSGIVDYVPKGAVARGEALVRTGGAGGQPCAGCHGADLKGAGEAPALAGRAPTYLARMLWDIRTGARKGPTVAPMTTPASGLSEGDITNVVAYLGSLKP